MVIFTEASIQQVFSFATSGVSCLVSIRKNVFSWLAWFKLLVNSCNYLLGQRISRNTVNKLELNAMGSAVQERENAEPASETTETPLGKGTGKHSQMYCSNSPFIDLNPTRMNSLHYLGVFFCCTPSS